MSIPRDKWPAWAECDNCRLVAVKELLEAAKRVDDLSEGPIHDFDALWSACEELHRVIRRVESGQ